ncbi:rust resistance kinase Lr10-like [Prosopis cineraria]|uniref:rust resistance kinase Lr10-like n=1 Tax=Prosopis cineraria TaxID=364024 RepID=UPI0024100B85|nr:rust resistance kinase Lr10-like [Prosopis cineraria]XP_054777306.1 rust resistance kinase Lr10-like [Prosopis cineraria]XP_054777307.1 rust resistance kinase Lr10-like [Prosopis cineraria]XP_054777308.1 rust resistance kinase Lr10-like [Prosopis cineraria]
MLAVDVVAEPVLHDPCIQSRCSVYGPEIRFPFRLKGKQPEACGYGSGFDVYCTETNKTVLELPSSVKVFVQGIDYKSQFLTVSDPDGCLAHLTLYASPFRSTYNYGSGGYALFNCSGTSRRNSEFRQWGDFSCVDVPGYEVLAIPYTERIMDNPLLSCMRIPSYTSVPESFIYSDHTISLSWPKPDCRNCEENGGQCKLREDKVEREPECIKSPRKGPPKKIELAGEILGPFLLIFVGVIIYWVYAASLERQGYKKIRQFLEDYKALRPARYSYADIKRITNQFKDELGQGAYGTVYEGKLSNEILVAVKLLNTSTGNGREFINEMETMCQIHHVNVARLVGYCADGFKRALVYEFLPNGSLQKFITSADRKDLFLGWAKLHDIALGIAKGIEYLHEDCDKRILHFDIKPHNILLDDKFTPKISDFGLAKLCSKDQSIVSMTTARGTLGYIAPEIFSRNFGNVSYKSDVYSYGMLLLEMVGGRKITDVTAENTEQVYYPQWIYNLLENNEDIQIHIEEEEDTKIARKLSIIGLWCIQWHPANRPTMKNVVQMLEGDDEKLILPPNPFGSAHATRTSIVNGARRLKPELSVISEIE